MHSRWVVGVEFKPMIVLYCATLTLLTPVLNLEWCTCGCGQLAQTKVNGGEETQSKGWGDTWCRFRRQTDCFGKLRLLQKGQLGKGWDLVEKSFERNGECQVPVVGLADRARSSNSALCFLLRIRLYWHTATVICLWNVLGLLLHSCSNVEVRWLTHQNYARSGLYRKCLRSLL